MTQHTPQDSQSELDEILVNHYYDYKDAMEMQGGDGDIKKAIAVTVKYRQAIEAYVTTRVKEAERDLIILKSHTAYLAGTLEGILGEPHPYVLKHLPDLTTTTNGKEE